jgi:S-DNA-T family DNA segregation ATPase FtsK/SpoIIIE
VLGDSGSGRTGLLRTLVREVARTRPTDLVLVVDPRGTLTGALAGAQVLAHVTGDPTREVAQLAGDLTGRMGSGPLEGPDVWVVIDDLDLVPSASWQPLVPLLARASDIGLHVVAARRVGGAARAFYEPLLGQLRELGGPGVLLAGSPEEGPLLAGVRPRHAPPGRARWVRADGVEELFQVAWTDP